jgi:hypothetical protein
MGTPTQPLTKLHARGAKKGSEWGTAVALAAGDEIKLIGNSGLQPPVHPLIQAKESNTPFVKVSHLGLQDPVDISPKAIMRYDNGRLNTLLASVFGTAGVPTQNIPSTGTSYTHIFQWADDIAGLFATWVEERAGKIYEVPSAKVYKVEFGFEEGELKITLSLRGDTCKDDSTVNTATQIDAITIPASMLGTEITFKQAVVKMNAESGGDISGETALILEDFSMVFERPAEGGQHVAGSDTIIEPQLEDIDGHESVSVKLVFPRMIASNAAFFATYKAGTTQKMLIEFTGALIETTYYYKLSFFYPRLKIKTPTFDAEAIVKAGLELVGEEAASSPTGMDHARPYVEIVNTETTDYLA